MNIIHLISNKVWGGGERYALDLCRALEQRGHSTAVITRKGHPEVDAPFLRAGIAVGHLPLRGAIDILSPLILSRILDRMETPVAIHVHNFKDAVVALRARRLMRRRPSGVRIVCTRHLVRPAKTGKLDRNTYRDLDAIIFVSDAARREFMTTAPAELRDNPKIHTLHNSIIIPQTSEPANKHSDFRFIYTGRISPEKGLDTLIEAFAKVEARRPGKARLTICGTGDSRTVMPIVRTARGLGIDKSIDWLGHVDDVFPEIRKAAVGIMPSKVPESFGLAALEFMSQGIPVIASDNGALPEIVRAGTDGLLVPPASPEALADAMTALIDNPDKAAEMGQNAKKHVENDFAYDAFVSKTAEIYLPAQ